VITLITGAPGAGKTLLAVSDFLTQAEQDGRTIIADGIPDLAIVHQPAPAVPDWTTIVEDASSQDGKKLLFSFPQGSLVVIDEAQRVYRLRAVGSKVPPEVAAFETHRHQGLDFLILTQHPNLIDSNVRKLVGRHLHIRDLGILGRKVYEWPELGDPNKFRTAPIQRKYPMRKQAFSLYKSASLHVKPQRGIPKGLLVVALCVPLLLAGSWLAYRSIQSKIEPPPVKAAATAVVVQPSVASGPSVVDRSEMLVEFSPRVPGRPETAPAFDSLRQVKLMPVVAGCIQTKNRCTCQTQTGHDAGLDRMQCEQWIKNPPFDPYREPPVLPASDERPQAAGTRPAQSRPADGSPVDSEPQPQLPVASIRGA